VPGRAACVVAAESRSRSSGVANADDPLSRQGIASSRSVGTISTMGLQDIIDITERVGQLDEDRRDAFGEELTAFEDGDIETFTRTRDILDAEYEALAELRHELEAEMDNVDDLIEYADFLTVDQAVRHRDQTVEKLRAHNEHLREFHEAMTEALSIVESNLDDLESEGVDAVEGDPEPHFQRAHDALEAHNDAVDGLGTNMTILNAYLI
jgi:chromosome segregation ATPase